MKAKEYKNQVRNINAEAKQNMIDRYYHKHKSSLMINWDFVYFNNDTQKNEVIQILADSIRNAKWMGHAILYIKNVDYNVSTTEVHAF